MPSFRCNAMDIVRVGGFLAKSLRLGLVSSTAEEGKVKVTSGGAGTHCSGELTGAALADNQTPEWYVALV